MSSNWKTTTALPRTTRALVIRQSPPERKPRFHDAVVEEQPIPAPKSGEVVLWIRKGMYPRIAFGSTFGADGAGMIVAAADAKDALLGERVFLTPMRGWEKSPHGPESTFGILGSSSFPALGTFSEYVVVDRNEVLKTPPHLTDEEAAACPLAGLTAWRAVSLAQVSSNSTVLISGIGGGVALFALQFCIALGASVYVTSSSDAKIARAVELGARGGVKYTSKTWGKDLAALLPNGVALDCVIDGGGSEILKTTSPFLKQGGRVVCYGMTGTPANISLTMREVMRNQAVIGTTMGSRADMVAATNFIAERKIVPVVAKILPGLDAAEQGFTMMQNGSEFGKIVVKIGQRDGAKL
ncbi:NAD(P)-binding protein [Mycena kentingensis (nom. inval.)]|nr:NAD(P)-binding protein [Mycena kentingensis (nom. inval.)]